MVSKNLANETERSSSSSYNAKSKCLKRDLSFRKSDLNQSLAVV